MSSNMHCSLLWKLQCSSPIRFHTSGELWLTRYVNVHTPPFGCTQELSIWRVWFRGQEAAFRGRHASAAGRPLSGQRRPALGARRRPPRYSLHRCAPILFHAGIACVAPGSLVANMCQHGKPGLCTSLI